MSSKIWPFKPASKARELHINTTAAAAAAATSTSTSSSPSSSSSSSPSYSSSTSPISHASATTSPTTPITPFSSASHPYSPKEASTRKPRTKSTAAAHNTLPQARMLPAHSNAFNCQRATGMNKLQQLQFVQLLKQVIIDDAEYTCKRLAESATFQVTTVRKDGWREVFPRGFSDGVVFVARLVAVPLAGVSGEAVVVVEESEEEEFLADAVESLWEKMMARAGQAVEVCPVDFGDLASRPKLQ